MLTDVACRKAAPAEKEYRLADAHGMYLLVMPSGFKSWRLGFWFNDSKARLVLGAYPEMSLQAARAARDEARALIAAGEDPRVRKKQAAAARKVAAAATFRKLAEQFLAEKKPFWSASYYASVARIFKNYLYPYWGSMPFGEVTRPMIAERLKAIEALGIRETAMRAREKVNGLREWALDLGYEVHSQGEVKAGLRAPTKVSFPAMTKLDLVRKMLEDLEAAPAHPVTRLCSRLIALTAMRPGTVQQLPWKELGDLDPINPIWLIPAERMKLTQERKQLEVHDHLVPLAKQTVELIEVLRKLTGRGKFVFPGMRASSKPISDSTVSKLYRDNGYRDVHVPHGWRSSFSTIMNEIAMKEGRPGDRVVIDIMLAHQQEGTEAIYNRAAYMDRRREIAQEWADLLLKYAPPAEELLLGPRR